MSLDQWLQVTVAMSVLIGALIICVVGFWTVRAGQDLAREVWDATRKQGRIAELLIEADLYRLANQPDSLRDTLSLIRKVAPPGSSDRRRQSTQPSMRSTRIPVRRG